MKMKRSITKILIAMLVVVLAIGTTSSLAAQSETLELTLSYFRKVNGKYTNGYALNTNGNEGESHHPVYQIMDANNNTNYYCLNAIAGETWMAGTVGTAATYNKSYNLDSQEDINALKNETFLSYKNVANSQYLKQILWILENVYIPVQGSTEDVEKQNLENKRSLLAKAGIVYEDMEKVTLNGTITIKAYKYVPQSGYDYSNSVERGQFGYFYYDSDDQYHDVELPDDMVEVAQQAAIWYYTNYKDNNSNNSNTYNVKDQFLPLLCSNGNTENNSGNWTPMENIKTSDGDVDIGKWKQEQAAILCSYLIDAADNYAKNSAQETTGSPLTITPSAPSVQEKSVDGTSYYVVGPITINSIRNATYNLNNTITVNGSTQTGAYISNADGAKNSDQTVGNYVGKEFYVAVAKNKITKNNIAISFDGSYVLNKKTLWVNKGTEEQPVVKVEPGTEPIELEVNSPITREFDLALRKRISFLKKKDSTNTEDIKKIINEDGQSAIRSMGTYLTSSIKTTGTATYYHRKDPVVVEKGDIITYTINVYNEGDVDGYAAEIIDKLPQGLKFLRIDAGSNNYSCKYDENANIVTITNTGKNVLKAYDGGEELNSDTITLVFEVTQEPSSNTNTYLTNIAYISKYHSEEAGDITTDRDSSTQNFPSADQNTTGTKYTGYHGGDNKNGESSKDVYNDGTNNNDYFPGKEDDDDFEVVVVKPAAFDLALQKYISNVYSNGTTKAGRTAPKINTQNLANKTKTTATYTQDKTPIQVKSGDYVTYTFTVYNEGEKDGYANKITDNIPKGLQFVYPKQPADGKTLITCDSDGTAGEIEVNDATYKMISNSNSSWSIDQKDGRLATDSYNGENTVSITADVASALGGTNKLLKAYDSSKDTNNDGSGLDRLSITVVLRVVAQNGSGLTIRNEAAITEATDAQGNKQDETDLKDRDSQTNQWLGKDGDKKYQDDEDYDNIILGKADLALTKFITAVSQDITIEDGEYLTKDTTSKNAGKASNPYTRATKVDTTKLKSDANCHDATYTMVKDPLTVPEQSYVLYNIRVYNEGETDIYAGEIKDYLPNYLDFVDGDFNKAYGWKIGSDGKTVTTQYLAYNANDTEHKNLLKAFNKTTDDGAGSGLDYRDIQILCRVNSKAPDASKLVNSAEVTKYQDEDGKDLDEDIDSKPGNLKDKNTEKREEDDDDYEVILVKKKKVDLSLTKFITAISEDITIEDGEYLTKDTTSKNAGKVSNQYTRATKVDTTKLKTDANCHDATYTMVKDPLTIPENSYVLYNIRVYNEGEVDVYAGEIKDYLPNYLDYVDCDFNKAYGWELGADKKTVATKYLAYNASDATNKNLLKAFNKTTDDGAGSGLDYRDIQILCQVSTGAPDKSKLVNSAEITKYQDKDGKDLEEDVDSKPGNLKDKNTEKREEDDDDYEVVLVKKKRVDLALTKFITAISNDIKIEDGEYLTVDGKIGSKENPYLRATKVDTKELRDNSECHDATYIMVKDPLSVPAKSYVLYNIRVYNEGETDAYAGEITDKLPEYLDYVDCDFNTAFGWKVGNDGKTIKTTVLAYNKDDKESKNLLKAFDKKTDDGEGSGLDYRDVQVLCRVNDNAPTNTNIINVAEITKYEDPKGDDVPNDIDSTPDNVDKKNEDDDDYEVINVKTFDLSLLKYVTTVYVTEDGKTTTTQTGNTGDDSTDKIPKVEINKKKLDSTIVKFGYTIKITNEGDIAGYAKEITDYVPEGLKFYGEDNQGWTDEGNNVISTRLLENTLLQPGESAEVTVILRWMNATNNLGLKTNTAEISEDHNDWDIPDRDSTPDNQKPGEDDIDDASVILSIKTGAAKGIAMYVIFGAGLSIIFVGGIILIKKYVL